MTVSSVWFFILLSLAALLLMLGRWLGEQGPRCARLMITITLALIALAVVARFRPTALHGHLPLSLSIWLEGVLPVFPWVLLVGVLWTSSITRRLHRPARLMVVLGLVYYLFGGVWMILPAVRITQKENRTAHGVVLQTRPDTCVPAACATALDLMGIPTTEREMCHIVMARPGRGSTLARAAYGLQQFLERRSIRVMLEDLDPPEVARRAKPDRPILVVIRSNIAADHMVVVLGRVQNGVVIANPSPGEHGGVKPMPVRTNFGYEMFEIGDFARLCRRGAIVFEWEAGAPFRPPDSPPHEGPERESTPPEVSGESSDGARTPRAAGAIRRRVMHVAGLLDAPRGQVQKRTVPPKNSPCSPPSNS